MELRKSKKAQGAMNALGALGIGIATLAIILTVAFMIMAEGKDTVMSIDNVNSTGQNSAGVYSSAAWNGTSELQGAVDDVPGWVPIVVITAIGSILILMVRGFGGGRR